MESGFVTMTSSVPDIELHKNNLFNFKGKNTRSPVPRLSMKCSDRSCPVVGVLFVFFFFSLARSFHIKSLLKTLIGASAVSKYRHSSQLSRWPTNLLKGVIGAEVGHRQSRSVVWRECAEQREEVTHVVWFQAERKDM